MYLISIVKRAEEQKEFPVLELLPRKCEIISGDEEKWVVCNERRRPFRPTNAMMLWTYTPEARGMILDIIDEPDLE